MNAWSLPFDVMRFELRRSMTLGRLALWFLLVAFPVAIIATISSIARINLGAEFNAQELVEPFGMTLYFLVPEVTCLLGLLLWATPAISSEIEGQTWVYLTMRSAGRSTVLLGKYMTAVVWTLSAALVSVGISALIIGPEVSFRLWWVLSVLSVLSCVVHAALYVLIGAVFYRRTMVAAVVYTMVVEYGMSFVPALVNKLTVNYRLRGLLADWMGWEDARSQAENIFGSESATTHVSMLAVMALTLITLALWRVGRTEYPTQQEG
ncbi:hypothetical protein NHH03_10815 [Stieleria sp. TO1_6]|uniref:hypothetical protein n=1 Tax=Stieleria tagensis TaxID=2956795 RepID=UPI00209B4EA2|nr:hypothetical protein [Stieleria tagensis]MCO8122231.1 hypothetical protein [Stieleria tagensis]